MTYNYKIANGTNRALVCYCATQDGETMRDTIKEVFAAQNIDIEPFIYDDSETVWTIAHVIRLTFDTPQTSLNIALNYADKSKRLKVGGSFQDVCVGTFFYNQPPQPEPPEPTDDEPEPEPAPSITSLVCDALRETFGGVFGASAFVVPDTITEFTLEVE